MRLNRDQREWVSSCLPLSDLDVAAFVNRHPEIQPIIREMIRSFKEFDTLWNELDAVAREAFEKEHAEGLVRTWLDEHKGLSLTL